MFERAPQHPRGMMQLSRLLVSVLLYCFTPGIYAEAPDTTPPKPVTMPDDYTFLSPKELRYFVDDSHGKILAQILAGTNIPWQRASRDAVEIKRHADVWLHFTVELDKFDQIVVENNWNVPLKNSILYWQTKGGLTALKPQRLHASLFALRLGAGRHDFYLKLENIEAASFKPTIQLFNFRYLATHFGGKSELLLMIYGIAVAMIIINFALLLFYKKFYFLYYIMYSMSMMGLLAIGSFHLPNRMDGLWLILNLTYGISTYLFVNSALSMRKYAARYSHVMAATCGLLVAAIASELIFSINSHYYVAQLLLNALAFGAASLRAMQGYRPARFFAVGWAALLLGYGVNSVGMIYHLPGIYMYSAYVGFAVELILFGFAVGYKAWLSERAVILENTHAFKQLEKVFFSHQIKQIRSGRELEETMPTGPGEACVICFDIAGSSKIQHEKTKEFLQRVFRRCYELMHENYDAATLVANAYRIKEMGDGFICSVGYPFKSPTGFMAKDALALSYRFIDVFHQEVLQFRYHTPIHCCIALAMDHISGFFPESGTKSYDLFGRAVVLATRYEGMRKVLWGDKLQESVIILHERVYASIDPSAYPQFTRHQLKQNDMVVRDDPSAEYLFYRQIAPSEVCLIPALPEEKSGELHYLKPRVRA